MGGDSAAFFHTTCWTLVGSAGRDRTDLERLLRSYWSPVYAFIRRKGYREHDAADLTQEFLHRVVLGRDLVGRASPERGRFRSFLKQALRNFLIDQHRSEKVRVPETGAVDVGTVADVHASDRTAPSGAAAPDEFDRQWAATVLQLALDRVETGCRADGQEPHWRAFLSNVVLPSVKKTTPVPLEELAKRIGAADADQASNMIQTVKRRFRRALREVVAETVEAPELIDEELGDLRRLLG